MDNSPSEGKQSFHVFSDDVLSDADAVEIARRIQRRDISAKEAVQAAIARIEQTNPVLNAVVETCYDIALEQADQEMNGCLAGVPTMIKDDTQLAGTYTQIGSRSFQNPRSRNTEIMAKQVLSPGLIALGKTTMPEFGFNATTEFSGDKAPTRNPWNTDYSSGGSSGGAAALVASGALPIAHGKDGGGSIRIPAANCGLVGLKPSRYRCLPSTMSQGEPVNITADGVLTRSVRDTAYFFSDAEKFAKTSQNKFVRKHYEKHNLRDIGLVTGPQRKRLNIGYVDQSVFGHTLEPAVLQTLEQTAELLRDLGHEVKPLPLFVGKQLADDFQHYWCFLAFMLSKFGRYSLSKSFNADRLEPLSTNLAKQFLKNWLRTPAAIRRLKKSSIHAAQTFNDNNIDLILSPTMGIAPPPIGYLSPDQNFDELFEKLRSLASFTPYANVSGLPAISLPTGFEEAKNLPISSMFMARNGDEKTLLEIAYEIENAQPFRRIQD